MLRLGTGDKSYTNFSVSQHLVACAVSFENLITYRVVIDQLETRNYQQYSGRLLARQEIRVPCVLGRLQC